MAFVAAPIANSKLPQSVLDLRARLSASDVHQRLDAAAEQIGLPKYTEIPRPGLVATWTIDNWIDWGAPYGFVRGEDTTRSRVMEHTKFPGLTLSYSKSGGDLRSMMNSCCDFRRSFMSTCEALAMCLIRMIDGALAGDQTPLDVLSCGKPDVLRGVLWDFLKTNVSKNFVANSGASQADQDAMGAMPGVLKTLDKEFNISPRAAFAACGYGDVADRLTLVFKVGGYTPGAYTTIARCSLILLDLRNYLESQRAIVKAEHEQKQAARRALRDAKDAKRDPGSKEKFDAQISATRAQITTHYATVKTIAENLFATAQRVMDNLKNVPFPEFPGSPVEILQQRDDALSAYDTIEVERDALKSRVDEDRTTINRLEGQILELQKKTAGGAIPPEHAKLITDLVTTIQTKLKNLDLNSIMAAIKEIKARADEVHTTVLPAFKS